MILALCGSSLSPSVASSTFKGQHVIDVLNAAGVDIGTLGYRDFDFGPEVLRQRMKQARCPIPARASGWHQYRLSGPLFRSGYDCSRAA